jgi:hypothetical protein
VYYESSDQDLAHLDTARRFSEVSLKFSQSKEHRKQLPKSIQKSIYNQVNLENIDAPLKLQYNLIYIETKMTILAMAFPSQ